MIAIQRHLFAALVAAILLGTSTITLAACKVTSTWEPWEPYQFAAKDGHATGLDNDLVRAIAKAAGCDVTFIKRPWKRSLEELKVGKSDIAPGASITEERKKYAKFSDPYRMETMSLLVLKSNLDKYHFKSFDELVDSGMSIGAVRGYYYGEGYKKAMENKSFKSHVQQVSSDDKNLKKLLSGRIEGALVDPYVGMFILKQLNGADKVAIHKVPVNSDNIYLMYSKKSVSDETVSMMNEGLKKIKASGEYQKIVDSYLN